MAARITSTTTTPVLPPTPPEFAFRPKWIFLEQFCNSTFYSGAAQAENACRTPATTYFKNEK